MKISRRQSIAAISSIAVVSSLQSAVRAATGTEPLIATNMYPWSTFAKRAKEPFQAHSDQLLEDIASCGIAGYEPIINSAAEFDSLGERLEKHSLKMRSIYVNSTLHDESLVDKSIESVVEIGDSAAKLGVKIIVTNPSPIRWGGPEDKTDSQLRLQAKSLDRLGAELKKRSIVLAYHNHDAELRQGAREFHHMLTGTDATNVKFCLDSHWVFRGCGDSEVAVFDALEQYKERIVELHLRQSKQGVWTEAFTMQGDIDYVRLFGFLESQSITPHLVLEQAVENGSANDLGCVKAHRKGNQDLLTFMSR